MEKNKKILLIGGGGHCKSVLDSLLKANLYDEIAIIDRKENIGKKIFGVDIIGCDNDLSELYKKGYKYAFITIGSIGNPSIRIRLSNLIKKIGFQTPNIVDPTATLSENVHLSEGIYIGKNSIINAGSLIERFAIINTGSIVEHDCIIGEFSHVSPGCVLCGGVQVSRGSHIGAGSVIKQQVKIGLNTLIGMGSVVLEDIAEGVLAYGNPCKEVRML